MPPCLTVFYPFLIIFFFPVFLVFTISLVTFSVFFCLYFSFSLSNSFGGRVQPFANTCSVGYVFFRLSLLSNLVLLNFFSSFSQCFYNFFFICFSHSLLPSFIVLLFSQFPNFLLQFFHCSLNCFSGVQYKLSKSRERTDLNKFYIALMDFVNEDYAFAVCVRFLFVRFA